MPLQSTAPDAPPAAASSANPAWRGLAVRLAFVLLCLVIYRLGEHIPLPGVTPAVYAPPLGHDGTTFSGSYAHIPVFVLGIMPYVYASILMQLVIWGWPRVAALTETRRGRLRINGIIRILTVLVAAVQANALAAGIERANAFAAAIKHMGLLSGGIQLSGPGWFFHVSAVVTLTAGTMFLVWLSEQITARGIGNGVLVLLLAQALIGVPPAFQAAMQDIMTRRLQMEDVWPPAVLLLFLVAVMVFFERAWRLLPVQSGTPAGGVQYVPLKLNGSGIIPLLFAPALIWQVVMAIQMTAGSLPPEWNEILTGVAKRGQPLHIALMAPLIFLIAFYSRTNSINPKEAAAYLKHTGASMPGVREGQTAAYTAYVLARISAAGALYLATLYVAVELLIWRAPFLYTIFDTDGLLMDVLFTLEVVAAIKNNNRLDVGREI